MSGREKLLILDAECAEDLLGNLGEGVRVLHWMPPHVVVLRGGDAPLARISARAGVTQALERDDPGLALNALSAEERLFVRAWLAGPASGVRPGEGLAWDTPGYTPPM